MAVEFALVMPMLIVFVGACIQFGTLFFVQKRMENTARLNPLPDARGPRSRTT